MSVDSTVLPYIVEADFSYTRLEVSVYSGITANIAPVVTGGMEEFTGTVTLDLNAGDAIIQFVARNYDPYEIGWEATTPRAAGYRFVDGNGYVQSVIASTGSTGTSEPAVFTASGAPGDLAAKVTGISITGTTLTVTAANNFSENMKVSFNNLLNATFLNGQQVVITSVAQDDLSFTANFVYTGGASYSSADSGTAGVVTSDGNVTWLNVGFYQISPTVQWTLIPYISGSSAIIGPPSGLSSYKSQVACRVEWLMPTFTGTVGTKVMVSTDSAGINPPYVQYGNIVPTTAVSRVNMQVLGTTTTENYNPDTGVQIITTTNQTQEFTYNYVDISPSVVNGATQFYAMLSTVVQDPITNAEFESQQNGPLLCGFVNLSLASPTDFLALQRKEDIAGRLISYMTQLYPNLDLTPRSEMRDLLIDPVSTELSNMSVREWFARCATSVSAMSQVDDANGDGISDNFTTSPIKQQISRAFGLNVNDTQSLIDRQFDVLAEDAGLIRDGAIASVVTLTFYSYVKPTQSTTFPVGTLCATTADSVTPSLSFITTGSAAITPNSAASFYDPVNGWWAVSIPASCQTTGSNTNAGARTINTVSSGGPSGWSVTNLVAAVFGLDDEINSSLASRTITRQIVGVDSGTRNGYYTSAASTPGVVATEVVAAGDLEMVRDWDNIRQKHVYGCVDVYCQGTSSSEEDDIVAFDYRNSGTVGTYTTYLSLVFVAAGNASVKFQVASAAFRQLEWPLYQGVELLVQGPSNSFFLDISKAQFDTVGDGYIILDPSASTYYIAGSGVTQVRIPYPTLASPLTNLAAVQGLGTNARYFLCARLQSPLASSPVNQPITNVNSAIGQENFTGTIPEAMLDLVHTSDFLLNGGSNQAGDEVQVASTASQPITVTLVASASQAVAIGPAMDVPIDQNGNVGDVLSVRSTDLSILYANGTDYDITVASSYRTYGLGLLTVSRTITGVSIANNVLTVDCTNSFGTGAPLALAGLTMAIFLNGQNVTVATSNGTQFTAVFSHMDYAFAADTGSATGSAIQDGQQVIVGFNQFILSEHLSLASMEPQVLNGGIANALGNNGFVYNTWLPESWGNFTLTTDGAVLNADGTVNTAASTGLVGAGVPHDSRYVKVVFQTSSNPPAYEVMLENVDYILAVDTASGTATIARNLGTNATSRIPDGGQVLVSYFYTEAFTVATEYPSFVPILVNRLDATKAAAASVLVKAMVANPIDITLTVTLDTGISADTVDSAVRTAIDQALDSATGTLYQSEIISQVQQITGVKSVAVPLVKCAKSDGSYDIGFVIPTGTAWTSLAADPAFAPLANVTVGGKSVNYLPGNSFITTLPILPDSTVPSGGPPEAFVGLLYEGQAYARTGSAQDFLLTASTPIASSGNGSFYIIGSNDELDFPNYNGQGVDYTYPFGTVYAQKVIISIPADTPSPSLKSYFVTFQVWGEGSAKDVTLSSTEYFTAGRVTINYVTTGS